MSVSHTSVLSLMRLLHPSTLDTQNPRLQMNPKLHCSSRPQSLGLPGHLEKHYTALRNLYSSLIFPDLPAFPWWLGSWRFRISGRKGFRTCVLIGGAGSVNERLSRLMSQPCHLGFWKSCVLQLPHSLTGGDPSGQLLMHSISIRIITFPK